MPTVVVTRPLLEDGLQPLRDAGYDVQMPAEEPPAEALGEDFLIDRAREADALIPTVGDPVTARVMDACPRLQIVAQYAVGYDNIDLDAARERGLPVTHTPGVLTDATADFAMALLLAAARHVPQADRFVREDRFDRWETKMMLGMELSGKTLGIVGLGRIGQAVARRALGFGMKVLYHQRSAANPTVERQLSAQRVPFAELLAESDAVSIHCALNDDSRHLFDADAFEKMKPTALLVNTARGAVIDEAALAEALAQGEIAGAGLDVFEEEPQVHPGLREHDRVVLAPHLGSATTQARTEMGRQCNASVQAALEGDEEIPHRVA